MLIKTIYSQAETLTELGIDMNEFLALATDAPVVLYKKRGTAGGFWITSEALDTIKQLLTIKKQQNNGKEV